MSEVSIAITVCFESAPPKTIVSMLGPSGAENSAFNGYTVEESARFDNLLHASLVGGASLDLEAVVAKLKEAEPASLLVDAYLDQVGESFILAEADGKKSSKAKVLAMLRQASTPFDAYLALSNDEGEHLLKLAREPEFDFGLSANGLPVLIALMVYGKTKALKDALGRGADIGVKSGGYPVWVGKLCVDPGSGLLAVAFAMRSTPLVKLLLRSGVDLQSEDEWGGLPLHRAVAERVLHKYVPLLIEAGADVNQVDVNGWTPLFALLGSEVAAKDKLALAEELMGIGADIHHVAPDGTDATWVVQGGATEVAEFVGLHCKNKTSEARVDFYDQFESRCWALELAMQKDDFASFSKMLPVTELSDSDERHLLRRTIEGGRVRFLEFWVEAGRPINRAIEGMLADRYAKAVMQPKAEAFLREQLEEFRKAGEQAILRARPVYEAFTQALEELDQTGSKDWSEAKSYLGPEVNETIRQNLAWWARISVPEEGARRRVKVSFDHELKVSFRRPSRFTTVFVATINTSDAPKVCGLGMSH